jgi:molecular chaperone GrpE
VEETVQPDDLEVRLETALKTADKNYDSFLRVSAEFDNYKKRTAREMNDFRKFANESLVKDLLPVVDNLERALESSGDNGKTDGLAVGIQLTLKEILKILDRFNVKAIEALGKSFDPCFHQAVLQEETGEQAENTVLKEFQKGYMLHDRLIRPSMVVVSKAMAAECNPEKKEDDIGS